MPVLIVLISSVIDSLLNVCNLFIEHIPPSDLVACFLVKGDQDFLLLFLDALHVRYGGDQLLQSDILVFDVVPSSML